MPGIVYILVNAIIDVNGNINVYEYMKSFHRSTASYFFSILMATLLFCFFQIHHFFLSNSSKLARIIQWMNTAVILLGIATIFISSNANFRQIESFILYHFIHCITVYYVI